MRRLSIFITGSKCGGAWEGGRGVKSAYLVSSSAEGPTESFPFAGLLRYLNFPKATISFGAQLFLGADWQQRQTAWKDYINANASLLCLY